MKKKVFLIIRLLIFAALAFLIFTMASEYFRKDSGSGERVVITIEKGSASREVAAILKEKGLIRYELPFLLRLYLTDYQGKLRYGTFSLYKGMSLDNMIRTLSSEGEIADNMRLTIPEGYTIERTARALEKKGIMDAEEFRAAVRAAAEDSIYADILPAEEDVLYQMEGFLYPDTYYFSDDISPEELADMIFDEFDNMFGDERRKRAAEIGMTVEEVLTRASMVQKETERAEEYPIVADVIQNRLDINMNLQFDSTVVYAVTEGYYGKDRVLYSDLKVDSPYNTYLHKGLPPGPICSPGLEAIDGVLYPDDNNYLFFQTDTQKNDGSNLYFETYEEHSSAAATTETGPAQTEPATETAPAQDTEAASETDTGTSQ